MNVLIYSGQEVLQSSLTGSLWTLRNVLFPHYSVQIISPHSLATHSWALSCALLVFPACQELNLGAAKSAVQSYVENGGKFLAFGTAATVVRSHDDPATLGLDSLSLSPDDVLRLYDDQTKTYLYLKFGSVEDQSHFVTVHNTTGSLPGIRHTCPHNITGIEEAKNAVILAKYEQDGKPAAIQWKVGKGIAAVWCPHIERPLDPSDNAPVPVISFEELRHSFIKATLKALGLTVPDDEVRVTRSLPLLLASTKPGLVDFILQSIGAPSPLVEPYVFEGADRIFTFYPYESGQQLLIERRASSTEPPPTARGKKAIHVIACPDGQVPEIPVFNLARYFDVLKNVREKEGLKSEENWWGFGEVVFYGEVVSSTQSMFDL
jgi:biotin---protein ligase